MVVIVFFQFQYPQMLRFVYPFLYLELFFFMIYNVPLFSVKSAFCIKFMAQFLLINLIM